jgi:pimeloyl-ACP methyl ester carboxylesterase
MMAAFTAIIFSSFGFIMFGQKSSEDLLVVDRQYEDGLTWFGRDGRSEKLVAGRANRFFDPTKPSIIFIHGWMPDQVGQPPTFMVDFPAQDQDSTYTLDLASAWVDEGWNIGIFYWHPFSDEDFVWDAEDKIWTPNEEVGMRYRDTEGSYHTNGVPTVSVSEMLIEDYLAALVDFSGPEIRIAGHSLGNQLAVNLTAKLIEKVEEGSISEQVIPSRIALLDPFWSPFPKSYLDELETGEYVQQQLEEAILPRDILVEWYHSSLLTESAMIREDIPNLKAKVLYAELDPRYCDLLDQVCKHDGAWHIYFLSYGLPPPPECIPDATTDLCELTGIDGPMASTSNQRIAEMMTLPYYWVQGVDMDGVDGRYTPQPDDDWFHRRILKLKWSE